MQYCVRQESRKLELCSRNFVDIITWYFWSWIFRNNGNMNLSDRVFYWTGDIDLYGEIACLAFWLEPIFLAGLQAVRAMQSPCIKQAFQNIPL